MKQLTLIFAIILFATGFTFSQTKTTKVATAAKGGYKVGDIAKDFSLKNIDDSMVSLASIENAEGYIIVFTCNHCPVSKAYEDRLVELHNKYAPQGYPVVAINPNDPDLEPDDSFKAMKKRAKKKKFPFAYLFDDGQKIYPQFGATRTPHVFILDKERTVKYIGAIDDNTYNADEVEKRYIEDAVASMIAGNDPSPSFTRAIGCSIKDKNKKKRGKGKGKRKRPASSNGE